MGPSKEGPARLDGEGGKIPMLRNARGCRVMGMKTHRQRRALKSTCVRVLKAEGRAELFSAFSGSGLPALCDWLVP